MFKIPLQELLGLLLLADHLSLMDQEFGSPVSLTEAETSATVRAANRAVTPPDHSSRRRQARLPEARVFTSTPSSLCLLPLKGKQFGFQLRPCAGRV